MVAAAASVCACPLLSTVKGLGAVIYLMGVFLTVIISVTEEVILFWFTRLALMLTFVPI